MSTSAGGGAADWLQRGAKAFNAGAFFEAHEHWEEAWRLLSRPQRTIVQGLIQVAAGLHHLQNGRPRPAAALLARAGPKLAVEGPAPDGLRVAALAADVEVLLAELRAAPTQVPALPALRV